MSSPNDGASLSEESWETLVDSIVSGECTPFLGAGIAVPHLPTGALLARVLARRYEYPLDDITNLARVSQYVASTHQPAFIKRRVCKYIARKQKVAKQRLGGLPINHLRLARLELPVYITTNYDEFLQGAIGTHLGRSATPEICRWNDQLLRRLGPYQYTNPTSAAPAVFHLHGHLETPSSILLTEDDYVDFAVNLARRGNTQKTSLIPHWVRRALGDTDLLFIGYSLEDWNFRVLMRHLMEQQNITPHNAGTSISIQLANHKMPEERRRRAQKFLEEHLKTSASVDVYWGDAGSFLEELETRVDRARRGRG
jgi:SIR2-like domain